jgi:hypothetical protein
MIEITRGVVTGIDNRSGHYKPVDETLALALSQLKLAGMDLKKITVTTQVKEIVGAGQSREVKLIRVDTRGDKFLAANGSWNAIRRMASGLP